MPVGEWVKRAFVTEYDSAKAVVDKTWLETLESDDKDARTAAQRLLDWYNRDRTEIKEHLITAATKTFASDIRDKWHFPVINAVPRTIKRLSQAYRQPPERELVDQNGELIKKTNTKAYDNLKRLYEQFDPDTKFKDLDNYGTLLNTCHFEVVPRGKGIDWDIRLRPTVTVLEHPDNYLDFIKFAHRWGAINPDSDTLRKFEGWIYWSEDEHYMIREDMRVEIGVSMKDGSNPYRDKDGNGVIPIVTIRKIEQDEYWGRFGSDLVESVEQANVQLANLWENGLLQTCGIPMLINCKLPSGAKLKWGPRDPVSVDGLTKEDVPPEIKFAKPDPDIKEMMDLIDWYIKEIGATYGLPPSAWALEEKRMSGFAKFLDNLELLENREDELATWQRIEEDAFNKSRIVYNTWAKDWSQKPIDENISLKVTFPQVQFPESPKERAERLIAEFAAGVNDPINHFIETEGLSEEEATEKAMKIAKNNATLKRAGAGAALEDMVGKENLPPELQEQGVQ